MTDMLRCSLVFDSFDSLYRCFAVVARLAKDNGSGGILRVKDRYNPQHVAFGYRDLLINIRSDKGAVIVCEVQLHHTLFYRHKKISHDMYKKARLFDLKGVNRA